MNTSLLNPISGVNVLKDNGNDNNDNTNYIFRILLFLFFHFLSLFFKIYEHKFCTYSTACFEYVT